MNPEEFGHADTVDAFRPLTDADLDRIGRRRRARRFLRSWPLTEQD